MSAGRIAEPLAEEHGKPVQKAVAEQIAVQPCGCVALPEAVARDLDMGPGAVLAFEVDSLERSLRLSVVKQSAPGSSATATSCDSTR